MLFWQTNGFDFGSSYFLLSSNKLDASQSSIIEEHTTLSLSNWKKNNEIGSIKVSNPTKLDPTVYDMSNGLHLGICLVIWRVHAYHLKNAHQMTSTCTRPKTIKGNVQQFAQILNLIHLPNTWNSVVFTVKCCNQINSNSSIHQTWLLLHLFFGSQPVPLIWIPEGSVDIEKGGPFEFETSLHVLLFK